VNKTLAARPIQALFSPQLGQDLVLSATRATASLTNLYNVAELEELRGHAPTDSAFSRPRTGEGQWQTERDRQNTTENFFRNP
jgi:hypothetical protein